MAVTRVGRPATRDDGEEELEPLDVVVPTPLNAGRRHLHREEAFRVADFMTEEECSFCGKRPYGTPSCTCETSFCTAFGPLLRQNGHPAQDANGHDEHRRESIAWVCCHASNALCNDEDFQKYLKDEGVTVVKFASCSSRGPI